jgi:hypothetical protein
VTDITDTMRQLEQSVDRACDVIDELREQRDELLETLKSICESAGPAGIAFDSASSVIATRLIEDAHRTIAKYEGVTV